MRRRLIALAGLFLPLVVPQLLAAQTTAARLEGDWVRISGRRR